MNTQQDVIRFIKYFFLITCEKKITTISTASVRLKRKKKRILREKIITRFIRSKHIEYMTARDSAVPVFIFLFPPCSLYGKYDANTSSFMWAHHRIRTGYYYCTTRIQTHIRRGGGVNHDSTIDIGVGRLIIDLIFFFIHSV